MAPFFRDRLWERLRLVAGEDCTGEELELELVWDAGRLDSSIDGGVHSFAGAGSWTSAEAG